MNLTELINHITGILPQRVITNASLTLADDTKLDWSHEDWRWVASTMYWNRADRVFLTACRVVKRGAKWVQVAEISGDQRTFWVRRPHQASMTPRAAVLALLERKKCAVRNARERLERQEQMKAAVAMACLDVLKAPTTLIDAPAAPRERDDDDYDSPGWQ